VGGPFVNGNEESPLIRVGGIPGGSSRLPFLARYGRFVLVGLTGVVVNLLVFTAALDTISPSPTHNLYQGLLHAATTTSYSALDSVVASAIAFGVATLWNFFWNNAWTFRTRVGHRHSLFQRLGLYYGVSLGSLAVNEVVLLGMALLFPPLYGQALGIALGSVVGFVGNHRFTFAETTIPS
jgi:putative flippase GtrA